MKRLLLISLICIFAFSGCANKQKVDMTTNSIISNSNDKIDSQIESGISEDTNQEEDIILYKGWVISKELKGQYPEVPVHLIGETIMHRLMDMDEVAYVRFASVYRQFKDINTFMEELNNLLREK